MFSRYKKPEQSKPQLVEVAKSTPEAGDAPKSKSSVKRKPAPVSAQVVPMDKEKKRKERLGEIKVELHKRLLDNLNLGALETATENPICGQRFRRSPAKRLKTWRSC